MGVVLLWCLLLLGWFGCRVSFLGAEGDVSALFSNSSALDSVHEALRLLDLVPRNDENQEQLLDDRAQALLWLYICTLESKLEEVCGEAAQMCPHVLQGVCSAP